MLISSAAPSSSMTAFLVCWRRSRRATRRQDSWGGCGRRCEKPRPMTASGLPCRKPPTHTKESSMETEMVTSFGLDGETDFGNDDGEKAWQSLLVIHGRYNGEEAF